MQAFKAGLLLMFTAALLRVSAATVGVTVPSANTLTTGFVPYATGAGTSQLAGDSPFRRASASVGGMVTYLEDNEPLTDAANLTLDWLTGRTKSVTLNQNTTFAFSNIPAASTNIQRMVVRVTGDGTSSVAFTGVIWQTAQLAVPDAGVVTPYILEALGGVISGYAGVGGGSGGAFWSSDGLILAPSPAVPEIDFFNDSSQGQSPTTTLDVMAVDDINTFNQYGDLYFRGDSSTGNASFSLDSVSGTNSTVFNASLSPTGASLRLLLNGVSTFYVDPTSGYDGSGTHFLSDDGTYKTGGGGSVGPGVVDTLAKFGPATTSITNSLVTEDATRLNVLEILHPNSIALNNTYTLLDADNINLTISNGLFDLESDDPVAANRTFTLDNGTEDNFELLLVWHTNAGELLNAGNVTLSQDWIPNNGDMLQLIWDAVGTWREQWRYPPAGGFATNALWASASGVLFPSPAVDVVSITSQLADNATNVALIVDTAVPWTPSGALLQAWYNNGTNVLVVNANGGLHSGNQAWSGGLGFDVKNNPDSDALSGDSGFFKLDFFDNAGKEVLADLYAVLSGMTAQLKLEASDDGYTTFEHFDATATGTQLNLTGYNESLTYLNINPTVTSTGSAVAYYLGTSQVLTNSDTLLSVQNAGSDRFTVDALGDGFFNGSVSIGSLTNKFTRTGVEELTYTSGSTSPEIFISDGSNKLGLGVGSGVSFISGTTSLQLNASSSVINLSPTELQLTGVSGNGGITINGSTNNVGISWGNGSPEGVVTRAPGSLYIDFGGENYIKATGTGSTGWKLVTHAIVLFVAWPRRREPEALEETA